MYIQNTKDYDYACSPRLCFSGLNIGRHFLHNSRITSFMTLVSLLWKCCRLPADISELVVQNWAHIFRCISPQFELNKYPLVYSFPYSKYYRYKGNNLLLVAHQIYAVKFIIFSYILFLDFISPWNITFFLFLPNTLCLKSLRYLLPL